MYWPTKLTGWLPQIPVSLCPSPLTSAFLLHTSPHFLLSPSVSPPFLLWHPCTATFHTAGNRQHQHPPSLLAGEGRKAQRKDWRNSHPKGIPCYYCLRETLAMHWGLRGRDAQCSLALGVSKGCCPTRAPWHPEASSIHCLLLEDSTGAHRAALDSTCFQNELCPAWAQGQALGHH